MDHSTASSRDLYAQILGLEPPWVVSEVALDRDNRSVSITVTAADGTTHACPRCGKPAPGYDHQPRRWRHLDTCQFTTWILCDVPRLSCPEHGVRQVPVPWAGPGSRFTLMFEALVIDWLRVAPTSEVVRLLGISWSTADAIRSRAVRRGLRRREAVSPRHLSVDETSFRKRHRYVTVVTDQSSGAVLDVADDRTTESLAGFFRRLSPEQKSRIRSVSMDMWSPYIRATGDALPQAEEVICFDRFHIAAHLGSAVDRVRRQENRLLLEQGDRQLVGTRYWWLWHPDRMSDAAWQRFEHLRHSSLKTARAWSMKETAMALFQETADGAAEGFRHWLSWASRCRLEPMMKAARMVRDHLGGILNAIRLNRSNAQAESINSRIQRIKRQACGFRSRVRFRTAILFHLGQLDLYP